MSRRLATGLRILSKQMLRSKKLSVTEKVFVNKRVVNIEYQSAQKVMKSLNKTWKDLHGPLVSHATQVREK